jgi:hypothetical protein
MATMVFNIGVDRQYPLFIVAPTHGLTVSGRGTSMSVVLGPAAGMMRAGTSTNRGSIPGIMGRLVARDGAKAWAAAHLLNAELGGSGIAANNLAPLTQTANKQHSGLELKVKRLCIVARQKLELARNVNYVYGVKYTVVASAITFGNFVPYNEVPSHFTVNAHVFKYDLNGTNERVLDATESGWFHLDTITNVEVHNRDVHLGF